MEILHSEKEMIVHKLKYELELLKRFEPMNCKSVVTPAETNHKLDSNVDGEDIDATTFKQLFGSLRYLCNTMPDICYAIGMVSRFISKPEWPHYQAAVRILRYVKGSLKHGILFPSGVDAELLYYSDSDWCGDIIDRRSNIWYMFMYLGVLISWCSKKHPVVALSTCEVELIVGVLSTCKDVWLMNLLHELKFNVSKPIRLIIDNKSIINLAKNPLLHGRSRQVDTKYHFLQNQVQNRVLEVFHCSIHKQLANVMTKTIKTEHFINLRDKIDVVDF